MVYIFRFNPSVSTETIIQEAKIIFPFRCADICLQGNYLVTASHIAWVIWDWKSDTWADLGVEEHLSPLYV